MRELRPEEVDALLEQVAAAVADRTPVDWDEAQSQAQSKSPALSPALERLREIDALRSAHERLGDPRAPATGATQAGGALFTWGPLDVIERLGAGSFAEVYRAWDPSLEREVALKLRRDDAPASALEDRRWIEEARRLARVRHPNVLVVHGADTHARRAGIWTELLRGQTLEAWLAAQGPLSPREAVAIGIDLCAALAAVHAAGLVHGDVTLRNVMRAGGANGAAAADGSGRIVLMDFGSAQDVERPELVAFGTPLYTAPEVLDGEARTPRADVYSVGIVLYRLLTGRWPIEPGPIARMRERLRSGERVALRDARPDLPPALVSVVERAASPDPERRFATASGVERALVEALPRGAASTKPSPLHWVLPAIAAAAIVAAVLLWPRTSAVPPAVLSSGDSPTSSDPAANPSAQSGPAAVSPGAELPAAPEVEATLYRVTAGVREALRSGDLVAPGDALSLEIETRAPSYAYVLDEDRRGEVFALFPLPGRGLQNPLPPGVRHRLPGSDGARSLDWLVTSAGGKETILILVSPEPLAPVEETLASVAAPRAGAAVAYPTIRPEALGKLRGVGGLTPGSPLREEGGGGMLRSLARDLSARAGRSLWVRLIELENPAP